VRAGFTPASRRQVFRRLAQPIAPCPFANLAMGKHGGWNEGVSAEDMRAMTWVLCHNDGRPLAEHVMTDLLAKVGRRAQVRSNGPHILRHRSVRILR
jgi:hypothetical protein